MTTRDWEKDDYLTLCDWLLARGTPPPHSSWLPASGAVSVDLGGEKAAMAWLYMDASVGIGHIDWLATRPGLTPEVSRCAVASVLHHLEKAALKAFPGPFLMVGSVRNKAMAKQAEALGFIPLGAVEQIAKGHRMKT
jgi:hypothetical protein